MRRFLFFGFFIVFCLLVFNTCSHENEGSQVIPNAVTDVDGNTYDAVRIGRQVWMKSNLRTKHFRNGKEIPHYFPNGHDSIYRRIDHPNALPTYELIGTSLPGYDPEIHGLYYLSLDTTYSYSYLGNDYDVLCPKGWHVPTVEEWRLLIEYVENNNAYNIRGERHVAKALASTTGWQPSSREGAPGCRPEENNTTGFSAYPMGFIWQCQDNYYEDTVYHTDFYSVNNLYGKGYFFIGGIGYEYVNDYQDNPYNYALYDIYYGDFGLSVSAFAGGQIRCIRDR
ncbi:MAG: fibrobacter succinogenes major paralogous domain-containing protein [Bacteroidales bacterium]|nr:fibrobacter succinogenes major paralogous domain-containing protein [Bacteroidales bacterium]